MSFQLSKSSKQISFFILFLSLILLTGCESVDVSQLSDEDLERISEKAVVCNEPYIRMGVGCCLDKDANGVCDEDDKGESTEKKQERDTAYQPTVLSNDERESLDQAPSTKSAYSIGDPHAPVTIIEFGNFECPFCSRFHRQTLPSLKLDYIETGKVALFFKHLPLSFHQHARKAAEAAECAGKLGGKNKFWEMHDILFENQRSLTISDLKSYATDIGIDENLFDSCLDNGDMAWKVKEHLSEAEELEASGTPTFFINGEKLVGAQPYDSFRVTIERELRAS